MRASILGSVGSMSTVCRQRGARRAIRHPRSSFTTQPNLSGRSRSHAPDLPAVRRTPPRGLAIPLELERKRETGTLQDTSHAINRRECPRHNLREPRSPPPTREAAGGRYPPRPSAADAGSRYYNMGSASSHKTQTAPINITIQYYFYQEQVIRVLSYNSLDQSRSQY